MTVADKDLDLPILLDNDGRELSDSLLLVIADLLARIAALEDKVNDT